MCLPLDAAFFLDQAIKKNEKDDAGEGLSH